MQRLWVSGYRSYELNVFGDKDPKITIIKYALKSHLKTMLEDGELDWIISGANLGVEQWALETGIELRPDFPLRVSMMTPYEQFSNRWNESNQTKFSALQQNVDFFASTSNMPYQSPVQLRGYQNFMLEHTDKALLIYDPEHPGKPQYDYNIIKKYQESHNYDLSLIDFYDLQDAADEYQETHRDEKFDE